MVEIRLYEDDEKSVLSHKLEPFRVMVVSSININNLRRIFTVLSVDGKELISFYFLSYSHDSNLFCFYNVNEKTI